MLYMNIVSMYVSHKRLCNYEYIPLNIKRRFAASISQSDDIAIQKMRMQLGFVFVNVYVCMLCI